MEPITKNLLRNQASVKDSPIHFLVLCANEKGSMEAVLLSHWYDFTAKSHRSTSGQTIETSLICEVIQIRQSDECLALQSDKPDSGSNPASYQQRVTEVL